VSGRVVQGWHPDPFGLHEARYFSAAGEPTKLVRDSGVETYDEPPSRADEVATAMARMPAGPEPPGAHSPRDAYSHGRGPWRGSRRRRPDVVGLAASGIILAAIAVAAVLVAMTIMAPKRAGTPGATDVAFVTQAATQTLQQHTAHVVLSVTTLGGATGTLHGTGAFDLSGKAGTLKWTMAAQGVMADQEVWLNGRVYLAISYAGRSLLPKGKSWIEEQVSSQASGTTDLTGGDPTAGLVALEKKGITVSALGTKVIGGVGCTGYTVTTPGAQATITAWINPRHLVSELSTGMTFGILSGRSTSAAPTGSANATSVVLRMDFSYSAAPVHVASPPAGSTISYGAFLEERGQSRAG
jgi:hypothetical protein